MRKMVKVISIALATLSVLMVLSPTMASPKGPTVRISGGNGVRIDQIIFSTYRFGPAKIHVAPHATLTFQNTGTCADCAHTISVVNQAQLPTSFDQVFGCGPPGTVCFNILSAQFPNGPNGAPVARANVTGEPTGWVGSNSLFITQGQSLEVTISAKAGTTFQYMCAFHAWMQGSIIVGQGDNNDNNSE